jgi:16S rRNA (cytosine967-C5)-methyltransferase
MSGRLLGIAAKVIESVGRGKPADAALRAELRGRDGISRAEGRVISRAVFAYYRWYGWLDIGEKLTRQVGRAVELNEEFRRNPDSVPEAELRRAIPQWIADYMEVSPAWLRALQMEPALWLRARPGQGRILEAKLAGTRVSASLADALSYEGEEDLFRTKEFQAGAFELQDVSSQFVGLACAPQPGETWWDACAGEGGKTLHLCDLMRNRGLVWASDRAAWRLRTLKRRAARAGLFNYRAAIWNGDAKLPAKTKFDGVLVDAPCSGVGTWQRNPHARWTTQPQDVAELAEVQQQLLVHAAAALKPGGRLFYSVCTLTRPETSAVATAVGKRIAQLWPWPLEGSAGHTGVVSNEVWLWPQVTGGNGMFIAAWRKEG